MRIVGLMSGTSHDGIDIAVGDFDLVGEDLVLTPVAQRSVAYPPTLRAAIEAVLPPRPTTAERLCQLDTWLGQAYGAAVVEVLGGAPADLVVSHGQTVYHWVVDAVARGTTQLGAPGWIAAGCGLPVLSDLRTADIAAGGQGAPLVPMFDALLLGGGEDTRVALNLGGIANITVLRPGEPVLGYDTGPANVLLDLAAQRLYGQPCDWDGRRAAAGTVDAALLRTLLAEPYYAAPAPKSTGRELFHAAYLDAVIGSVAPADVLATLTELTARTVTEAVAAHDPAELVAAGGGVRNPVLWQRLTDLAGGRWRLRPFDEFGIPGSAREAYAFALLGWLSWHGLPGAVPSVTGAGWPAVLGAITPGPAGLVMPARLDLPPLRLRVAA